MPRLEKPLSAAPAQQAQGRLTGESRHAHEDSRLVVSNHSGYEYAGAENYEHDDTGSLHNYSGAADEMFSAIAENDGWQEGYDF